MILKSKYWLLAMGFATIIALIVTLELISLQGTHKLAELTGKLYQHPLIVSNAVLEIKINIISIHRNMKDIVLARSSQDIESAISRVDENKKHIHHNFDIVMDRFLGDKSKIIEAITTFDNSKAFHSEIIELARAGKHDEAAAITTGKGAKHLVLLMSQIDGLIEFARNKAEQLLKDSEQQREEHDKFIYALFIITVLIAMIVAFFVIARVAAVEKHLKETEEQILRSQKMDALGKLTGGIAHDYNNMLGVIMGYAELLELALSEQPKLAEYARKIHRAGDSGSKLTSKLLSFSRNKIPEADCVNLNYLLLNDQHMLEKTLTSRIKLHLDLTEDLWALWLDENDMEDSLLNICINTMHAIEGTGQLIIRTSNEQLDQMDAQSLAIASGDYVLLSITDTGSGMDQETRGKIFEPFFSTKGEQGTGLGLSQVYGFVERSNGAIKVYSEQGHGTRLALYFPRYYISDADTTSEKNMIEADVNGAGTILVVDDETDLLNLSCEILRQHGFNVSCAESAKDALIILEHEKIDVMISDIIMPETDGYQLAASVKEKYPAVKILLVSGFADDQNMGEVDESLQHNLLAKPFNAQALLQKVHQLLIEK